MLIHNNVSNDQKNIIFLYSFMYFFVQIKISPFLYKRFTERISIAHSSEIVKMQLHISLVIEMQLTNRSRTHSSN